MLLGISPHLRNAPTPNNLLFLNNTPLQPAILYKYLGIPLNPQLTLTDYSKHMIRLANIRINTLSYFRQTLGQKTSLLVYKGTILPLMEYGNILHPLLPKKDKRQNATSPKPCFKNNLPKPSKL